MNTRAPRNEGHPYQNPALTPDERTEDLLARMTLEEKAGQLFHTMLTMNPDGTLIETGDPAMVPMSTTDLLETKGLTHFNLLGSYGAREMALWQNALQERAAATRLGIPVTLSTDPRNAFTDNPGAALNAGAFSQWPEPIGLGAIGDAELVHRFADTVRREYLAVGFRVALHPQIDLATDPRWSRQSGTFGNDARLTGELAAAYVRGLQGDTLGSRSVATMVKHFPGGGPQKDGEDPHFPHGKEQIYPGGMRDHHLAPFKAAIAAGASQMMPYYGQPIGTDWEEVGFGFNKDVLTGLLRDELGFTGIVCTDWGLLTDAKILGETHVARAWGVEHLSPAERAAKSLDAGADQFGGEQCPELIVELVRSGRITETRIDASVGRLLREKFVLGLFDNPYVDIDAASRIVGNPEFTAAGEDAQRRAITVLTNRDTLLPLTGAPKLYLQGVRPEAAAAYGQVVSDPAQADIAVVRLSTPYEERANKFESFFHSGDLSFPPAELAALLDLMKTVPTIACVNLERAAVFPEIADHAAALLADFGASDTAVLDVVFGHATAQGRLPFELPRSMAAVAASREDVPNDTEDPVFPAGHGLTL